MATSISQQIIAALETRAAAIRTRDGYNTNAGERVYWARPGIEPGLLPCVVIWPGTETVEPEDLVSRGAVYSFSIRVEGLVEADPHATGHGAEAILADLREAIYGPVDETLGGIARGLLDLGSERQPRTDGGQVEGASITLQVQYYGQHGDPYTSG